MWQIMGIGVSDATTTIGNAVRWTADLHSTPWNSVDFEGHPRNQAAVQQCLESVVKVQIWNHKRLPALWCAGGWCWTNWQRTACADSWRVGQVANCYGCRRPRPALSRTG